MRATSGFVIRSAMMLAAGAAVAAGSGCFLSRDGVPAQIRPDGSAVAWPERDVEAVRPYAQATPTEIRRVALAEGKDISEVPEEARDLFEVVSYRFNYNTIIGEGLVRRYEKPVSGTADEELIRKVFDLVERLLVGFEPNAEFLTSYGLSSPPRGSDLVQSRFENTKPEPESSGIVSDVEISERIALHRGVSLHLPEPQNAPARGVILHLAALYGNPYEMRLLDSLRSAGWVVFSVKPVSGISPPPVEAHIEQAVVLERRLREIRAEVNRELTPENLLNPAWEWPDGRVEEQAALFARIHFLTTGSFQACPGSDAHALGAEIANRVDEVLAESAYATEAVLRYIETERPELCGTPVVVAGFSAGALAIPAVCARLGERVDAAILIGGGADLFAISQESTLTDAGIRIRCGFNFVGPKTIEAIHRSYLEHVRLDPVKTAPLLAATPTLVIRSDSDEWVPARYGRLLVEKLGRPDVQTLYGGGHMILFWRLPGRAPSILRWLDRVAPPVAGGGDAAAGAADTAASRAAATPAR